MTAVAEVRRIQGIPTLDLQRVESLGDNCELGFVLRRLGCEDGMLFRWASVSAESLLATLRNDFVELYEFANLSPHRDTMVLDRRYGTSWHTGMISRQANGTRSFELAETDRRVVFEAEQRKRSHLVAKLRQKFSQPKPVFVLKCNESVTPDLVEAIHYQLLLLVACPDFVLLEVRADADRAGSVEVVGRTLLRGYVAHFAPYENASDGDDGSWHAILAQALMHHRARPVGTEMVESMSADIVLPFPLAVTSPLDRVVPGDRRAGAVELFRGNDWCRLVDDGVYRLHANAIGSEATVLRWFGVYIPLGWTIDLLASCAIPESKPVRAVLAMTDVNGNVTEQGCIFRPMSPQRIAVQQLKESTSPLMISLTVEPLERLRNDERAVIDVQAIICRPEAHLQQAEVVGVDGPAERHRVPDVVVVW